MGSRVSRVITLEIYKYVTKEVNQVRRLALPLFSTRHPRQFSTCIDKVRFWPLAAPHNATGERPLLAESSHSYSLNLPLWNCPLFPKAATQIEWRVSGMPQYQPLRW